MPNIFMIIVLGKKYQFLKKGCILSFVLIIFIPFKKAFFIQADFLKYY